MCGIVGYIGKKEAYPIVIKGLERLEYRGHDSAGVALLKESKINLFKEKGKELRDLSSSTLILIFSFSLRLLIASDIS